MTINAEFIHERCDGTTPEELASRSKMLRHGLRRIRTIERDLIKGTASPDRLRHAWSQLIETSSRVYRQDFTLKPDISSIEDELQYVDESVELQLPWHKQAAFAFHHDCVIEWDNEVLDMGKYHVDVVTRDCSGHPHVYVTPLKDCFCGYTGTLHPHISDGALCMGELRQHLYTAWSNRNIQAMIDMIKTTLDTYNPGSPYQSIEKWLDADSYCNKCNRLVPHNDRRTINPHGMPREFRGVWDHFLSFDYRSEWHPFYQKDTHSSHRVRDLNYPDGTFRDVTVCSRCFEEMRDHVFRQAFREAVVNHDRQIRNRRNYRRD